jgi:hypothetical protein
MTDALVATSGLTYHEQEHIIERVARNKAFQYRSVGYLDIDDLMQEVRIKCWHAMDKYDPTCGVNLYVFLSVCAENRIRDIKRSILYKHNKPCLRCPFWCAGAAASGMHDCIVYLDKMQCDKYQKHERYVQAKLSASHPIDIDNERIEDEESGTHRKTLELVEFIEARISPGLIHLFRKFKAQNFNPRALKPKERGILLDTLREIVEEYQGG